MFRLEHNVLTGEIKEIKLSTDEIKSLEAQREADQAAHAAWKAAEAQLLLGGK